MGEGLFQPLHLLVILAIALLVFGPKRLPGLGKGLGEAIRGFKDSFREKDEPPPPPSEDLKERSLVKGPDEPPKR